MCVFLRCSHIDTFVLAHNHKNRYKYICPNKSINANTHQRSSKIINQDTYSHIIKDHPMQSVQGLLFRVMDQALENKNPETDMGELWVRYVRY